MNLRTFLGVEAVVSALFGIGFLLLPGLLLSIYGVVTDPAGNLLAQFYGSALLGFGALNYLARRLHANDDGVRVVLMADLVANVAGFAVALAAQATGRGGLNGLGWTTVLLYLLLGAGAAYFLFMPQRPLAARARQ